MRPFRFCFYLLIAFVLVDSAYSQTPATMQQFGSFGGGPDVINLGSLNSHITIPIRHKAGRGTDFDLSLTYDSSVWAPVTSGSTKSWQPVSSSTVPGWQGLSLAGESYYSYWMSYSGLWRITCDGYNYYNYETWTYSNFSYADISGVGHSYPSIYYSYTDYQGHSYPGCGPALGFSPSGNTQSALAADGSGFTMYMSPNCCGSTPGVYIVDKNGTKYYPPYFSQSPSTCTSSTDRNGNQITCNNGIYTDTLGQTAINILGSAPSNTTLSYAAPNGTATFTVKYTAYTVQTKFGCTSPAVSEYGPKSMNLVSEIDLPDGSKYLFDYENTPNDTHTPRYRTGRISSVTLPTGGTTTYTYTNGNFTSGASGGIVCADGSAAGLVRTTNPGGQWTYNRGGTAPSYTTTITDPLNQQTFLQFERDNGYYLTGWMFETQRKVYSASSSLLQTMSTCYNGNTSCTPTSAVSAPITQRNVTSQFGTSGLQGLQVYSYDSYGNPTKEVDYDYKSGTPATILRSVVTSYQTFNNSYTGSYERPQQITICNGTGTSTACGTGTVVAQTTYSFTDTVTTSPSGTTQHVGVSAGRGNVNSVSDLVAGSTTLNKSFAYWDTGVVNTATDVNNATVTSSFQNSTSSCGNSFPTGVKVTGTGLPSAGLSTSYTWNCTGGVITSVTDENSQVTTTSYANDMYYWRPDYVKDPTGATVNYCYGLYNGTSCTVKDTQVESYLNFNSGNSTVDKLTTVDGFGRPILSQTKQSPSATNYDTVETDYDALGRVVRTTLPFQAAAGVINSSAPGTSTSYDALGRVSQVSDSGGGVTTYTPSSNGTNNDLLVKTTGQPSGENPKQRQLEYNGLGQLTSVCEVTAGTTAYPGGNCAQNSPLTGYYTTYGYDVNGNLLAVTQNAQASSGSQQTRSYMYDGLGRMTSETNPEIGPSTGATPVNYTYDTSTSPCMTGTYSGDLVMKVDPQGTTTCFTYDALHRKTSTTYSGGLRERDSEQVFCLRRRDRQWHGDGER